jgi:pimeloyl-ACP methyl ester carboxylesterase
MAADSKPTIVLVHGAFADASGWSAVFDALTSQGYPVYAPANPLRGVASDGEYLRTFISTIEGPVVLAGHSYGGCVITNASAGLAAVKSLVYIAAYAPDEGETLTDAGTLGGGSTELTRAHGRGGQLPRRHDQPSARGDRAHHRRGAGLADALATAPPVSHGRAVVRLLPWPTQNRPGAAGPS